MRGLSLMIQRLIKMIRDALLQNGLYIGLITGGSLVALGIYQVLNSWGLLVMFLSAPVIGILLLIQRWQGGKKELLKKSDLRVLAGHLWVDGDGSWGIPCQHCGKLTIIHYKVVSRTSSIQPQSKSLKRSRTRR